MSEFVEPNENNGWRPIIPMGAVRDDANLENYLNDPNYIGQVKKDGYRILLWFDKLYNRTTTRSVAKESVRAGNPWPTERTDCIPYLRDLSHNLDGTILDGEIWKPGCTSHDMTHLVGGLPETCVANQEAEGIPHYCVYDIIQYKGKDVTQQPLWERQKLIEKCVNHLHEYNNLIINGDSIGMYYIDSAVNYCGEAEISAMYEFEISQGREGMVLKHLESKYYLGRIKDGKGEPAKIKAKPKQGIPHTPWVKWKKKDTFDCIITGFIPAEVDYSGKDKDNWQYWQSPLTGKKFYGKPQNNDFIPITKWHYEGWIGSIIFSQYDKKGNLVEVGNTSGITDEWRQKFSENPDEYMGRVIVVEAFERIKKTNALREPRFKGLRIEGDKAPEECVIE